MNATISADIIASTSLSINDLTLIKNEIYALFDYLTKKYNGVENFWGRILKGDYIECFVNQPQNAFRVALLLKSLIKSIEIEKTDDNTRNKMRDIFKEYGVRVAIGIGEMHVADSKLGILDGEAIYLSGRKLESQKTSNKMKVVIKNTMFFASGNNDFNEHISCILAFVDVLFKKSTSTQCKIIYYRLMGLNEKEISLMLKISQSSVNQHCNKFGWNALEQALNYFENLKF